MAVGKWGFVHDDGGGCWMNAKMKKRKEFAEEIKRSDQEKAEKIKRQAGLNSFTHSPKTTNGKRIKSPSRFNMRTPPRDLTDRAEFFKDCKPSEVHQRKLEYQEYCETVLEHPDKITSIARPDGTNKIQCRECGKVLK
jgi:hypothetical protein